MASSSAGASEPPHARGKVSESEQNALSSDNFDQFVSNAFQRSYPPVCSKLTNRQQWLQMHPVGLEVKAVLDENKKACVELSGNLPFVSHGRVVHHRVSLSDFRRFIGSSDKQYDDVTAADQSTLRANPSHDPAQLVNINDPQARVQSRMMPGKPKCFHLVPHLLSLETALQCKGVNSIEKTFDSDHREGFSVYKVSSTGGWSLIHALVAALTFKHPSHEFSALDLYYHYRKAVDDEPVNKVSTWGFGARANPTAHNYTFDWDITAQAMDSYMEGLGFGPYTFILVQPPNDKMTPPSCVFTIPCALKDEGIAQMQRVWIMYTANGEQARPHFNVVVKYNTRVSPCLVNAVNKLEFQQEWPYTNKIRSLETDLMDRKVSMTSLALGEVQELFRETEAERREHMSRPGFGSKTTNPSRLSQRPNDRKRAFMVSRPSPLSPSDPETGHSRRKCRSASPMSEVEVVFPYEMIDTGSRFAKEDSDPDEVAEAVRDDKNRLDNNSSGSHLAEDSKIMRKSLDERDSDLEASDMSKGDIKSPSESEEESVIDLTKPVGNDTKRPRIEAGHGDDIPPPGPKKAKLHDDEDPFAGLVRPRPRAPAEVMEARRHEEQVARRRFMVFGSGGLKWQPKDRKKD